MTRKAALVINDKITRNDGSIIQRFKPPLVDHVSKSNLAVVIHEKEIEK